jgi:hypothetical protein
VLRVSELPTIDATAQASTIALLHAQLLRCFVHSCCHSALFRVQLLRLLTPPIVSAVLLW